MKSMTESETQLLRQFVPKLTRPQVRALTMLEGGPKTGSGNWAEGTIHEVCGYYLDRNNLAEKDVRREVGFDYVVTFTITDLGRTWLKLHAMKGGE